MGIDLRYGKVTVEFDPGLGEDEPVVVFRARDRTLVGLLTSYTTLCQAAGSPPEHMEKIRETQDNIRRWQQENSELVKVPD